ncbi:MAG TPA: cyclic 2,3-diphosphoglycerate synthase [Promineifilum sp.]|nr:cyclic 2,3-diphosphoglycerate synthase [Promineifilum sp.]HRO89738.1 cyclic 2,3-diphosphoglycerate synthase [Promineifilum sp.]HRQ12682.1 cyclic 2,3-diphosphoglycerate synthase [Promineifilum sp.]
MSSQRPVRVIIAGAAGRDFHDFNTVFRNDESHHVVAFTATQIPNIEGRLYPPALSGPLYPKGIPIHPESELTDLIRKHDVDEVVFSYSDVSHEYVMHLASRVLAAGAGFRLLGPHATMLKSTKPIISVCAVRTGSGKSQTSRKVLDILKDELGYQRVVAVRHPMPYGDLAAQAVQRFAGHADMDAAQCTIEEREEYEPYVDRGAVIFAGVDYEAILRKAEEEADVIIWDGGNNDLPFYKPDFHIVVVDPHRPGHELRYHPGEANLRMADAVIINKIDTADSAGINTVLSNIRAVNPSAIVVRGASPLSVEDPDGIRGKRVLVIEDGPTLTHGEMAYGAGVVAAQQFGAAEIIDPRPYAVRTIADTYRKYPNTGPILPAMGYGREQIADLEETINRAMVDMVIIATPIDLGRLVDIDKPNQRVRYELQEIGRPDLTDLLKERFGR